MMNITFKEFLSEAAEQLKPDYALSIQDRLKFLYKVDDELIQALDKYNTDVINSKILLVFDTKEDTGLIVFDAVQAKRGFGPLAYKIALTLTGGMAPTQSSKITTGAKRIWKEFYSGKGSKDVETKFFGAVESNAYMRSVYTLKKPLNLNKYKKNHQNVLKNDKYNERDTQLQEAADSILMNTMNAIY